MRDFNFSNAFMHFSRTDGPSGFVWKYVLSYGFTLVALLIAYTFLLGGAAFALLGQSAEPNPLVGSSGFFALAPLLVFPIILLFNAVFEAACQRRYLRGDGFRLRLGGDEWRLFVVYIIWLAFMIGYYMLIAIIAAAFSGGEGPSFEAGRNAGPVVGLLIIAFSAVWVFLAVRFAPAGALTVRDRAIRFRSAWRVTRGRFWTLFGSYLVLVVAVFLFYLLLTVAFGLLYSSLLAAGLAASDNPNGSLGVFGSPGMLISFGLLYLCCFFAYGWFVFVWAGPAALAARTDPERASMDNPAAAFQ